MSVQFGRWNFDGKPMDRNYLDKVRPLLAPYGPDSASSYSDENISLLYFAFNTTRESRSESQPLVTASRAVITWDGRLDNRGELIRRLGGVVTAHSNDVEIVSAAYEHWGSACFAMLIGDWALSIWDPHTRSVVLAKDPIGTRHLYYSFDNNQVTWSTILDPLVLFAGKTFALCEEYVAGWLSFFPAAHLTPYVGIHSVPPSSSVLLRPGKYTVRKYWDFDPDKRIRYRTDGEYEEHFRAVFGEAVRHRLRSDSPILAELSGGMDSSSIVCMADTIIAGGGAETPRLDTVSYYNDSEPNWNERPYFTKVEEKRGRSGRHIDAGSQAFFEIDFASDGFAATPSSGSCLGEAAQELAACIKAQGNRLLLSGVGGDEIMGGVPRPTPELEDLLARGHFRTLAHRLKLWALNKRKPWFYLLVEAARGFLPSTLVGVPKHRQPPSWLNRSFIRRNQAILAGYESRLRLFGPLASFQENVSTLNNLVRQLACNSLPSRPPYEKCYPYLDRGLLEFVFAIPREQLVRPGQRRSLMRRSLIGIVPDEVLNRRRKAYVVRTPLTSVTTEWARFMDMGRHMIGSSLGIIRSEGITEAVQKARRGQDVPIVTLMRSLAIESWLQNLRHQKLLSALPPIEERNSPHNEEAPLRPRKWSVQANQQR